jgi:flagellar L-ring protein FlgH
MLNFDGWKLAGGVAMILGLFVVVGCASFGQKLKQLVGGGGGSSQSSYRQSSNGAEGPSFSSQPNYSMAKQRRYKRVTKDNFSDEQSLEENSGSLWKKVGQGSYLFSQNNLRMQGDIINVEMEGKAADSLATKLSLIRRALSRYEYRGPASTGGSGGGGGGASTAAAAGGNAGGAKGDEKKGDASSGATAGANVGVNNNSQASPDDSAPKFDNVPCRIIERYTDGSYRIKGQQAIFVGLREYKLIVTGIVRPDDISSDLIASSKLIDSKYDLVASNKDVR